MKRTITIAATLLLAVGSAGAIYVDTDRWFAILLNPNAPVIMLSRAPCQAKTPTDKKNWFAAQELLESGLRGTPPIKFPGCWRRDPGGSATREYCIVDEKAGALGSGCVWIGNSHFTDTRSLPRQAPAY